jgi:hypothetical protein
MCESYWEKRAAQAPRPYDGRLSPQNQWRGRRKRPLPLYRRLRRVDDMVWLAGLLGANASRPSDTMPQASNA